MKEKAAIRYYYKRALLPLCICTAVFAVFTLLTARDNTIQSATAFGFNGRFFWCAYMFFAYKGFENLFDQQSVSRTTRFRALVGFLPFSGLVAAVNLLLCYGGILLYNHDCQTQILQNSSAVFWKYCLISDAEIPWHLFFGLTGFSEYGSAAFLIALGLLLYALSVMRGMLFGVLLARLFHKLPRRSRFLLGVAGAAVFAEICFLLKYGSAPLLYFGQTLASFLYGNSGASSTLSILFADLLMLSFYLIILRLTDGTVFRQRPTFRKQITRAVVGIALILVLGVGNVLFFTPAPVNTLARRKTPAVTTNSDPFTAYAYEPDERAFQLLRLQKELAVLPAYRVACLSALAQNYYLEDSLELENISYADGVAVFDELLCIFEHNYGALPLDLPTLYPAVNTFAMVDTANTPYEEKSEILANACLYFSKHGDIERAKRAYEAVVQPDFLIERRRHDIFMCAAALNCITLYIDSEQDRLWVAEQFDALADITEKAQYEYSDSDNARFRQSAAELRGEEISDSENISNAVGL